MTTLSISLSPETEAKLRERAAASGKDPETFVREAVEEKLRIADSLAQTLAPVHQEVAASGVSDADLDSLLQSTLDAARRDRRAPKGS